MEVFYFGERIERFRLKLGDMKKNKLASYGGVEPKSLTSYLKNQQPPPLSVIVNWVKKLDLNPVWFITGEGEILLSDQEQAVREGARPYEFEAAKAEREWKERLREQHGLIDRVTDLHRAGSIDDDTYQTMMLGIMPSTESHGTQPSAAHERRGEYRAGAQQGELDRAAGDRLGEKNSKG